MTMPKDLLFVRHGQSEANIVQKRDDHGVDPAVAAALFERPDWQHRLSDLGVEQAKNAGKWLRQNIGDIALFDALYVSPSFVHVRLQRILAVRHWKAGRLTIELSNEVGAYTARCHAPNSVRSSL